ncbi:MAG: penicillin-binding transpeptidase domain-containing protein, partial [Bacillota bacterium]|nr:penicillin-binding transpeptidase domain-containing protein [Bacillota bacterium]
ILFIAFFLLSIRVGYIQLVKGEEYANRALSQQTRDNIVAADRGTIYDRNGEKLAESVRCYDIYVTPSEIGKYEDAEERNKLKKETANGLAKILGEDREELWNKIDKGSGQITIAKGLKRAVINKVIKANLSGVNIVADTEREYPNGTLAANVMGMVNDEGTGQSGLELEYNNYLKGVSGRIVNYTDTSGKQLSYSPKNEMYYNAEDGCDVVTTIDLVIQSYTETAIERARKKTGADRVMAIVMETETGAILSMAQTPSFNPNNPYQPADSSDKAKFKNMSQQEQSDYLSKMWRNPLICDVYEPGSVFKLLTTSIALEEDETSMNNYYNCTGSLYIGGQQINCWNTGGHGSQSLKEAVGNSCNPVFMTLATKIGISKFYDYLDTFGITGTTGIDFPSEGTAILQGEDSAGPVGLATIGFGQGVAVTPIQLVTAVSSLGNEGKLMKPTLVKKIVDKNGKTVHTFSNEIIRQTVSKETADEMCEIMEYVVSEGGGGTAAVKGYKVGGKTGTANKAVNGGYSSSTYSSCLGMAPMEDPKLTVLVIVDSPKGVKYGSVTAGPAVSEIMGKSLKYLDIKPTGTSETDEDSKVEVPDVVGKLADEGIGILAGADLKYDMTNDAKKEDFIIVKQYPTAGTKVKKGTKVFLYKD